MNLLFTSDKKEWTVAWNWEILSLLSVRWASKRVLTHASLWYIRSFNLHNKITSYHRNVANFDPANKGDQYVIELVVLDITATVCWNVCRDDKRAAFNKAILSYADWPPHRLLLTGMLFKRIVPALPLKTIPTPGCLEACTGSYHEGHRKYIEQTLVAVSCIALVESWICDSLTQMISAASESTSSAKYTCWTACMGSVHWSSRLSGLGMLVFCFASLKCRAKFSVLHAD